MAASLEETLSKLLIPENNVIVEATEELRKLFQDPEICRSLCTVLCSSQSIQVRQYAAVLLRRRIFKLKSWNQIPAEDQNSIKNMAIQKLLSELEKPVLTAVAQLAATIAKHELPKGGWPELLQFIQEYTRSSDLSARELGMFILSVLSSTASEQLQPHLNYLLTIFSFTIQDMESKLVPFYTIQCLTALVYLVGNEEMGLMQNLVPSVIIVIKRLLKEDEDQACEALELLDELVECEVSIIAPHVKSVLEFCLEITADSTLEDSTKVKAMTVITWLTRLKKKAILKNKMIIPILSVLFPLMCKPEEDSDEHDEMLDMTSSEANTPGSYAAQVLDAMALHLPPEKYMVPLLELAEPALKSEDVYSRKGAFLAIAVSAEGCADFIRTKYLHSFLESVCKGLTDQNTVVRNAALFTLGQFSEYLQPEISKYAPQLLPLLFDYLSQTCQYVQQNNNSPVGINRMFYAVEMFCENLESGLVPYLPTLMERLFTILLTAQSISVKELALSAIGATANAVKEEMLPYFQQILVNLKLYLTDDQPVEHLPLQIQSLDTLGVLARTIGPSKFLPLAHDCIQLGLNLIDKVHDPDLRRCIYALFGSIASVIKEDMSQYLAVIIPHMITSMQSTEGVVTHYRAKENSLPVFDLEESSNISIDDDNDDDEEEEDEDEDVSGFSVENAFLDEKEDTCCALRNLAEHVKSGFAPYIHQCSEEVYKLIDYPSANVSKAALETLGQFCILLHFHAENMHSTEAFEALKSLLKLLLPRLIEVIQKDSERDTVMSALDTIANLLKHIKITLFQINDCLAEIVTCVFDVLSGKTSCQDGSECDTDSNDQAEYDGMLIEYAGGIFPALALSLPPEQFAPLFEKYLAYTVPKLRKHNTVAERSFATGTIAECIENMKESVKSFVPQLFPILLTSARDDDEEVRSNAIYGIGLLAEHTKEAMFEYYPTILQTLSLALNKETNLTTIDNISAAVARLIMSNTNGVPMDQVFPVFIRCLPIKEDMEENTTIFRCFNFLYDCQHPQVSQQLSEILTICVQGLNNKQLDQDSLSLIKQLLNRVQQDFPQDFQKFISSVSTDAMERLANAPS